MVVIQRFVIQQYLESIKLLECRYDELYSLWSKSNHDQALTDRLFLVEQEIRDLYTIVNHLSSPVPHSLSFPE